MPKQEKNNHIFYPCKIRKDVDMLQLLRSAILTSLIFRAGQVAGDNLIGILKTTAYNGARSGARENQTESYVLLVLRRNDFSSSTGA